MYRIDYTMGNGNKGSQMVDGDLDVVREAWATIEGNGYTVTGWEGLSDDGKQLWEVVTVDGRKYHAWGEAIALTLCVMVRMDARLSVPIARRSEDCIIGDGNVWDLDDIVNWIDYRATAWEDGKRDIYLR